jgi:NAD(P)-dependent dehydrogenase (short-subunit alcohol dehydrogenase family)
MNIQGTTALVTGANRGIGQAFVDALIARGAAKVYAAARNPDSITIDDPRVVPIALDVTDGARVAELPGEIADVQLVINNAGIASSGSPLSADLDAARAELEVNYLGLAAVTQAFAPVLGANGGGAYVNVLSVASWVANPPLATYSASKAAAWNFTNSARVALKAQGTHVVGVHVGYVDTDLTAGLDAPKLDPADVVSAALDALEAGEPEVAVDEISKYVKANLADDHTQIYPMIEQQFSAALG